MKKIIILLLVVTIAAFGSIREDATATDVKRLYSYSKKELSGLEYLKLTGALKADSEYFDGTIGTFRNNIQNLQLPNGTIDLSNSWNSVFFKIIKYIASAESQKEYYYRVYQYISAIGHFKEGYRDGAPKWAKVWTNKNIESTNHLVTSYFKFLVERGSGDIPKKTIQKITLFSSMVDGASNQNYAKDYFIKNGASAEWNRVREELGI